MKRARIYFLFALSLALVLGFGSTALANNNDYSLSISAGATETTVYNWTISKTVAPDSVSVPIGQPATVNYQIDVDRKDALSTTKKLNSTLTVDVKEDSGIKIRTIRIKVYSFWNHNWVEIENKNIENNGNNGKQYDKGPHDFGYSRDVIGEKYKVRYEVEIVGLPDKNIDSEEISVQQAVQPINITDTATASLPAQVTADYTGNQWEVGADGLSHYDIDYPVIFTNAGNGAEECGTFANTATIVEIPTESADASVSVCVPKATNPNPPEPREERKNAVRWPDRTPPPEEAPAELPKTGGFIEWEWLALAGGMLTSGGGALYLVRRRKMKK